MKQTVLYIILSLAIFLQTSGQTHQSQQTDNSKTKEYKNNIYRFRVDVPDNWKLYGQIIDDTVNHKAIADWGLPVIYSELEKTTIENSISITAYHTAGINSIDQLILAEYLRVDPAKNSIEVDSMNEHSRIIYSTINGLNYKGKSYFVFNNDIGYVINFMATPGTFDKNLAVFEKFYKSIKFQ